MKVQLRQIKYEIKNNPVILFRRPWYIFYLILFLFRMVMYRFKRNKSIVYLTETKLSDICLPDESELLVENIKIIYKYDEFLEFAEMRIREDKSTDELYYNEVKKRYSQGDYALVYETKDECPLSYIFVCSNKACFTQVGITLNLPNKTFGIYDVYTFKAARGKGNYTQLFKVSILSMKKKGYDTIWLWLMKHNTNSINVHRKLGLNQIIKIFSEEVKYGFIKRNINDVKMDLGKLLENNEG